jgi:hypothetical protein
MRTRLLWRWQKAGGVVRAVGTVPNTPEAVRRLMTKLGPAERLRVCYEAPR